MGRQVVSWALLAALALGGCNSLVGIDKYKKVERLEQDAGGDADRDSSADADEGAADEEVATDLSAGLQWRREPVGKVRSYQEALRACQAWGNDWRVPTRGELLTLLASEIHEEVSWALAETEYWSSSCNDLQTRCWHVDFSDGDSRMHGGAGNVRCVRAVRGDEL